MKLIYFANVRMPTEKAHGLQIMKTCEALARRNSNGTILLIVPKRKNIHEGDPFLFYGVQKPSNFDIEYVPSPDLLRFGFLEKIAFWCDSKTFASSVFGKHAHENAVFYTRESAVAKRFSLAGKNIFFELHTLPDKIDKSFRNVLLKCCGLIVISRGLWKELLNASIPEEKILVAPDAVDLEKFNGLNQDGCRNKLGISKDTRMVVYAGHLYGWKGADLVAEAAGLVSDVEFYLVGGTTEDVARFRQKYSFPNLHIMGWQRSSEIPRWLTAADIIVVPTSGRSAIGRKYTSPLKLVEAIAAGKPIIAADLSSIKEIPWKGSALFFVPDDSYSLASTVRKGFEQLQLMIARAKEFKRQAFLYTWDIRATTILSFIRDHVKN